MSGKTTQPNTPPIADCVVAASNTPEESVGTRTLPNLEITCKYYNEIMPYTMIMLGVVISSFLILSAC